MLIAVGTRGMISTSKSSPLSPLLSCPCCCYCISFGDQVATTVSESASYNWNQSRKDEFSSLVADDDMSDTAPYGVIA